MPNKRENSKYQSWHHLSSPDSITSAAISFKRPHLIKNTYKIAEKK
jgi:hypothetical protein